MVLPGRRNGACPIEQPAVRNAALALHRAWGILPGRKVAHALIGQAQCAGLCGQTRAYGKGRTAEPTAHTRLCEACVMTLVAGGSSGGVLKFFLDHVPAANRARRRRAYRAWVQCVLNNRVEVC